jgi:hypothetical protein
MANSNPYESPSMQNNEKPPRPSPKRPTQLVMVGTAFCLFAGAGALRAANWLRDIGAPRIGLAVAALALLSLSAGAIFLVRVLSRWSRGDW